MRAARLQLWFCQFVHLSDVKTNAYCKDIHATISICNTNVWNYAANLKIDELKRAYSFPMHIM